MSSKRVEIKVIGQVQGVFFRQGVKAEAERLGLTGWVKNEEGGSARPVRSKAYQTPADAAMPHRTSNGVKIVAEGEEEKLQKLVEWCRKGTDGARVEKIEVELEKATGEFKEFNIEL